MMIVLILVLVEDGLRGKTNNIFTSTFAVLILVLVEDGLRAKIVNRRRSG